MSVLTGAIRATPRKRVSVSHFAVPVSAGAAVGLSACATFVYMLTGIAVSADRFQLFMLMERMFVPVVVGVAFICGVTFALLLAAARQERPVWWRTLIVGAILPAAGFEGLMLAARLEPLGTSRPDLTLPVFRLAFVSASALVAFTCTLIAAWVFRVPASWRRALLVAVVTALAYLVVALAIDPIPGFHVGGGDRAMPKVAALCNLLAGIVGGSLALRLLMRLRTAPSNDVRLEP